MQMLAPSMLINLPSNRLNSYLTALGITAENISSFGGEFHFLEKKENGAFVGTVKGDFTYAIDIYLFNLDLQAVVKIFEEISLPGAMLAIPDDRDDDPEVYFLWREKKRHLVRVVESDTGFFSLKDPLSEAGLSYN